MQTPEKVESLFVFEEGSINTIIKDNHGTIYTNRSNSDDVSASNPSLLSDSDLRRLINTFMPQITKKRHWFALIKVLMLHGQFRNKDFVGAAQRIQALYPAGLDVEIDPADLQVMHVGSFCGPVENWDKESGPAKRDAEVGSYIRLGNRIEEFLKENFSI